MLETNGSTPAPQMGAAPVLTLFPQEAQKAQIEAMATELQKPESASAPSDSQPQLAGELGNDFTPEEKEMIEEFSKKIDLNNPQHVMLYGADTQKKVSSFSDQILGEVKNMDTGDVGDGLTRLIGELKGFESASEKPTGFRALFTSAKSQTAQLKARFDTVSGNVETIAHSLEAHQVQLLKDVAMLDRFYDENLRYFKELTMYIAAGEKRLKEVREHDLVQMKEAAKLSQDTLEAQKASDLETACGRFEKKLHDLKLTRQISLQMAPQIRLLQNNNALLIERIQSSLVNTLPLWKNQMVLALGLEHSKEAMQAQRSVTDMTNELLRKNAETLKMGTVETAKEAERGIIEIETLVQTNQSLIDTMNEVLKIQTEGRQKRIEAEKQLLQMEGALKNRLLNG